MNSEDFNFIYLTESLVWQDNAPAVPSTVWLALPDPLQRVLILSAGLRVWIHGLSESEGAVEGLWAGGRRGRGGEEGESRASG